MQITRKPKFHIGQKVWVIGKFCNECKNDGYDCDINCENAFTLIIFERIIVRYKVYTKRDIRYTLRDENGEKPIYTKKIYATKQEAELELCRSARKYY